MIYIPLWFYSNSDTISSIVPLQPHLHSTMVLFKYGYVLIGSDFSQHLHSTMVLFKSIYFHRNINLSFIYIPLWFYSNAIDGICLPYKIPIYIPLWFYSNFYCKLNLYMSINLHSTMVLFK